MSLADVRVEMAAIEVNLNSPVKFTGGSVHIYSASNISEETQCSVYMQKDMETRTQQRYIGMVWKNCFH